jgi:hypothetical protein
MTDTTTSMTDTAPPEVTDPHGLLATGEELATIPELARLLDVSGTVLRGLLGGPLCERVRFVRYAPGQWRYSGADARVAIEAHRPDIEARRQRAAEQEAHERAARTEKLAAKASTSPPKASVTTRSTATTPALVPSTKAATARPTSARPSAPARGEPEVFVMRRLPSTGKMAEGTQGTFAGGKARA